MDTIRIEIDRRTLDEDLVIYARSVLRRKLNNDIAIIRMVTPVDTGFLRSNWYWTTTDTLLGSGLIRGTYDPNAIVPNDPWNPAPQDIARRTNTWYIINNVSYGVGLNEGSDRGGSFIGGSGVYTGFFERAISSFILGVQQS